MTPLAQNIQAILFTTAEPQTGKQLAAILGVSIEEIMSAVQELAAALDGHAIMLVQDGDSVTLATRPEQGALIESMRKEELSKELTKASAETLAVIAYH